MSIRQQHTLLALFCLTLFWLSTGCGGAPAQVTFQIKGAAPSKDGSFTNASGWTIQPTDVRVVIGDFQLKREDLDEPFKLFSSLPSLTPNGGEVKAEDLGKNGLFPGMWAVNILYNAEPQTLPTGRTRAANWQRVQFRMSPAVSGVRGLQPQDPLIQNTVYMAGQIRKDTSVCKIRLRASLELGLAGRIQFSTRSALIHRNIIEIRYAKWLDSIQFGTLCSSTTKNTIDITSSSHPQIAESIRTSMLSSVRFTFSEGSAQ